MAALVVLVLTAMKWAINEGVAVNILGPAMGNLYGGVPRPPVVPILNLFVLNGVLLAAGNTLFLGACGLWA